MFRTRPISHRREILNNQAANPLRLFHRQKVARAGHGDERAVWHALRQAFGHQRQRFDLARMGHGMQCQQRAAARMADSVKLPQP